MMYLYSAISVFCSCSRFTTVCGGLLSDCIEQFTIFFEGNLADAPNFRILGRPQHRELRSLPLAISVWVLYRPLLTITGKMQETEPTAFRPYTRRLECLTACRCHSKGSTFSSVILRPWVWVQFRSWTPTSRTVVRRSSTWANQVLYSWAFRWRAERWT